MGKLRRLAKAITESKFFYVLASLVVVACLLVVVLKLRSIRSYAERQAMDYQGPEELPTMAVGAPAGLTKLMGLDGGEIDLLSQDAESIVLCFFSLAFPASVDEAPLWRLLLERGAERGVRTLVVSTDSDREAIARFARAYGVDDLPIGYDPHQGRVSEAFEVRFLPLYLHFDHEGKVLYGTAGLSRAYDVDLETRAEIILLAGAYEEDAGATG